MKAEPHFWMVWRDGGGPPTVKHGSFESARSEARRLARQHPGERFLILFPALAVVTNDLVETKFGKPVYRDLDEEIPF